MIEQIVQHNKFSSGFLANEAEFFDPLTFHDIAGVRLELDPETAGAAQQVTPQHDKKSTPLVVGIFPFIGSRSGRNQPDEFSNRLVETASRITDIGFGLFMLHSFYRSFRQGSLRKMLSASNLCVVGIINTPPRYMMPAAGFQPVFLIVSKKEPPTVMALDCTNYESIGLYLHNVLLGYNTETIGRGTAIDLDSFKGFEHWYVQREIESLESDFGSFERYELNEIAMFVNIGRTGLEFEDIPDSIYLPIIGNGDAAYKLSEMTMKHQNYCQIVVDKNKVTPEFMCGFLNSRHFRPYLEAEKHSNNLVIPRLNRAQIWSLPIGLPSLEIQINISQTINKLSRLRAMVNELSQAISLKPVSSESITRKIEDALLVFDKLTVEEHVSQLLRDGESKTVEFKQTYSLDVKKRTKEKYIEVSAIKTIAAFLNTDGGTLLIGVDDHATIVGVDEEINLLHQGNRDKFLLNFKNQLKDLIGEQFYPVINYELIELHSRTVFQITCKRSDLEVYIQDKDFYVRANPATDKLEGRKLTEYVRQRYNHTSIAVLG